MLICHVGFAVDPLYIIIDSSCTSFRRKRSVLNLETLSYFIGQQKVGELYEQKDCRRNEKKKKKGIVGVSPTSPVVDFFSICLAWSDFPKKKEQIKRKLIPCKRQGLKICFHSSGMPLTARPRNKMKYHNEKNNNKIPSMLAFFYDNLVLPAAVVFLQR